jgi:hypothetical protein
MTSTAIPEAIKNYIDTNLPVPVALIGCRAVDGASLDCCEYDIAAFDDNAGYKANQVLDVDGHTLELVYLPNTIRTGFSFDIEMGNIICLRDRDDFAISSMVAKTKDRREKRLYALGKKAIIGSLFHHERSLEASPRHPILSSMWLKFCAYQFLRGVLMLSGSWPMPLHELQQIRQVSMKRQALSEGVNAALECIGAERATRPAIQRSLKGLMELDFGYDRSIVMSKIQYLLTNGMLSDCYYYTGRVATDLLAGKAGSFLAGYSNLIRVTMDLASDVESMQRLGKSLHMCSKDILSADSTSLREALE